MCLWKKITNGFQHFTQGWGFAVMTLLCVAVITATAVWTRDIKPSGEALSATPPAREQPASILMQQSLQEAATPTPLPAEKNIVWQSPLASYEVIRPFSTETLTHSDTTGLWTVHAAADLAADAGAPVAAMADGTVSDSGSSLLEGVWIEVKHSNGYVTRYSGLNLSGAYRTGDAVRAGQTIGFVGNGVLSERSLEPHLHLQAFHDGATIDPLALFE